MGEKRFWQSLVEYLCTQGLLTLVAGGEPAVEKLLCTLGQGETLFCVNKVVPVMLPHHLDG